MNHEPHRDNDYKSIRYPRILSRQEIRDEIRKTLNRADKVIHDTGQFLNSLDAFSEHVNIEVEAMKGGINEA